MVAASAIVPHLGEDLQAFLHSRGAEAAFERVCDLVRECYPELFEMNYRLQEDPDVEGRTWCVISIKLPMGESQDERLARRRRYHERLVEELSFAELQHFGTITRYLVEQP